MNKLTETYDLYEVVKIPFPFVDVKAKKVRPALILSSAKTFNTKIGLSVMTMITSVKPNQTFWPGDIVIENLHVAGLPASSIIRFKVFSLDHRLILGRLGHLSKADSHRVQLKLKEILELD